MKEILKTSEASGSKEKNNNNIKNLDSVISNLVENLNKYKEILILEKDFLREFFECIAGWILKNFSSSKLNNLLTFLIIFFNSMNYKIEIQKEG